MPTFPKPQSIKMCVQLCAVGEGLEMARILGFRTEWPAAHGFISLSLC